jgi:hypothetical protein
MKKKLTLVVAALALAVQTATPAVYINEILPNAPGGDGGNEFVELRGTPGMSLNGYVLMSVEAGGAVASVPGRGDINQFFDLSGLSLGANGYLFIRQLGSKYTDTAPNAAVAENTIGAGFGNDSGSSVGYSSDGTTGDMENGPNTYLLINIGSGTLPTTTTDVDTDNDGLLDLPEGWTVVDSVGYSDGSSATANDTFYAAITFRAPNPANQYLGSSATGVIIDIPGPLTTTAGTFYVGRKGESTGSTTNDWVGSIADGAAGSPTDFIFYRASDPSYTGMKISDMAYGGPNASPAPLGTMSYTPTLHGTRFTTNTIITPGGPVGDVAVDPRDNTTILFTLDNDVGGGIYRAYKVASGNWWVDSTPVVSGLDRASGMVVQDDGTIWWVHDVTMSLMRLKAPWESNTPELVITNFGGLADDDPYDVVITPPNFTGTLGQPGWVVVADAGSDDNAYNALNLQDPATIPTDNINTTFLVDPTASGLGWQNVVAIAPLPQSGELLTFSMDSYLSAVNGSGAVRTIIPSAVVMTAGQAMAVDPNTGRAWIADDVLDEIWSVDVTGGPTAETKEISFPLVADTPSFRQINFHDPGMAFATNGAFLVVSDTSTAGGGGRLIIFHSEPFVPVTISNFSVTNVVWTAQGPKLDWSSAGPAGIVKYTVERTANLANPGSFAPVNTVTGTTYTDTNAPAGAAYYRVLAKP